MLPTPGASNHASPDNNQVNQSRSMLTGRKKRNREAIGEDIKKPSQLQLTRESPNVGEESLEVLIMVKSVEQSGKTLNDQINRRMARVKEKHWDQLRNYPEVSATVRQIEEKWPLLSNLREIKENMKKKLAEFKAGCLMEVDAKEKLLEVKKELNHIDQQLQLYSEKPCMKEIAATNDHEVGGQCTEMNDVTIPVDQDHGSLLANYSSGQSGLFNKDNKNASPLSHSDGEMGKDPFKMVELRNNCDIMMIPTPKAPNGANGQPSPDDNLVNSSNLMLTGPKKRNREAEGEGIKKQSRPRLTVESSNLGEENTEERIQRYNEGTPKNKDKTALLEAGVQLIDINDVIPIDQDNGSLLARKMMRRAYSSWNFQHFNEDNYKVDAAGFPALEQASQATEFIRQNIEVLVSNTIKEMQEWCTPKDSGWDQLKKWKATLNLGKTIGVEVKVADDMLENISLCCFAYSMTSGEG